MSLPLLPLDGEEPQQAPEKAPAAPQPELKAEAEDAVFPEEHAETELPEPEATADKLHRMSAELTLRCVLGGILTVVLLHLVWCRMGCCPPWRRWTRMLPRRHSMVQTCCCWQQACAWASRCCATA